MVEDKEMVASVGDLNEGYQLVTYYLTLIVCIYW